MSTEIETQISNYFEWVERRAGHNLRPPDDNESEPEGLPSRVTLADLEANSPEEDVEAIRHRRTPALAAVAAVVALVAGLAVFAGGRGGNETTPAATPPAGPATTDVVLPGWDGISVKVFVEPGATAGDLEAIGSALDDATGVIDEWFYLDAAASLQEAKRILADEPGSLELLDEDNIPTVFNLVASAEASDPSIEQLVAVLRSLDGVFEVVTAQEAEDQSSTEPVPTEAMETPVTTQSEPNSSSGDPSGAWVLVSGPTDPISGFDVTLEIDGDRIGGTSACNGYGGTVEISNGSIAVGDLGQTLIGCDSAVQQLETDFLGSLRQATTFSVSGEQLQITTPQGAWQFERLTPPPIADIVGTRWVVDGYIDGDTLSRDPSTGEAFIELSADGSLIGATNCRTLSGKWLATGSEIVFTTFGADGECPNDAAWDLDGRIIAVLGDGFSAEVTGDQLTLISQGNEGLTFRSGN